MTDTTSTTGTTENTATAEHKIVPNTNPLIDLKQAKFGFRPIEDKETGVKTKRDTVELDRIPVPSVQGIVNILETGGKGLELLLEAVANVVYDRARDVINTDPNIKSDNFNYDELSWEAIANLEKEDRRAGIPKEIWDDFVADYTAIMPALVNGTKEQSANAAKIFALKYAPVKQKKDVISKLQGRLALYAEHSPKATEFADILDYLTKRAQKLIEAKEENLADNLGL